MSVERFDHEAMLVHKHLMNKVQNGSKEEAIEAFGELYKLTYNYVKVTVFTGLPRRMASFVHDIVSETFVNLWQSRMRYKNQYEVCSWIHTSAKLRLIDFYRKHMISRDNKNKEHVPLESIEGYKDKFSYKNEEEIFDHETKLVLRHQIDKLPEPHKTILIEHVYNQRDSFQIAKIVDYSQRSVNTYIVKAKELIISRMKDKQL